MFLRQAVLMLALVAISTALFVGRKADWPDCDPIGTACHTPIPNSFYLVRDSSTETTLRVNFSASTLPIDDRNFTMDPIQLRMNDRDGFSCGSPFVISVTETPLLYNAPSWMNMTVALNTRDESSTLLIDADNGTIIAQWTEVDERSGTWESHHPPLLMYPARILENGRRYVVAMRRLISKKDGKSLIAPSAGFKALRDKLPSSDPSINDRRPVFEEIFTLLSKVVPSTNRSEWQLVFDFYTESAPSQSGRFIAMREDALRRVPPNGPKYYFHEIKKNPTSYTYAFIFGAVEVPLYLDSAYPGGTYVLVNNTPQFQQLVNVSFELSIPMSMMKNISGVPNRLAQFLQVGHGLFGNYTEIQSSEFQKIGYDQKYVVGSVAWWGTCRADDIPTAFMVLKDINHFNMMPDRLQQSLINHLYLTKMYMLSLPSDPLFKNRIDPSIRHYNGNSMGGIMGSVLMAVSPDLVKGVLGVGGSPFGMLFPRVFDFVPFWDAFAYNGYNTVGRLVMVHLMSYLLDPASPVGYIAHLSKNRFPNTPPKHLIFQNGLSDAKVSWLGGEISARTVGASVYENTVSEKGEKLYGFNIAPSNVTFPTDTAGSIFQLFSFDMPPVPFGDVLLNLKYDTHSCTRRDPRAVKAMTTFFNTGMIVDYCEGKGCHKLPGFKCP